MVKEEQAWFWTKRWQEGESEAEADICAGRVHTFDGAKEAIAFLHKRVELILGRVGEVKRNPPSKN